MHNSTYWGLAYQLVYFNRPGVFVRVSNVVCLLPLSRHVLVLDGVQFAPILLPPSYVKSADVFAWIPLPVAILPWMSLNMEMASAEYLAHDKRNQSRQGCCGRHFSRSNMMKNSHTIDETNVTRQHTISSPASSKEQRTQLLIYVKCVCFLSGILQIMKVIRP